MENRPPRPERHPYSTEKRIYYKTHSKIQAQVFGKNWKSSFSKISPSILPSYLAYLPYKSRTFGRTIKWWLGGRRVLLAGINGDLISWNGGHFNLECARKVSTIPDTDKNSIIPLSALDTNETNPIAIVGQENGLIKYATSDFDVVASIPAHEETVTSLTISPDGSKFASASSAAKIKLYDLEKIKEESKLVNKALSKDNSQHRWNITALKWHSKLSLIASGSMDNTIRLWDPREKELITTLKHHKHKITSLDLNSNFGLLSSSLDFSAKLIDLRFPGDVVVNFRDNTREITTVSFNPILESRFALGCADGSIAFYNCLKENALKRILFAHDHIVHDISWHPEGELLASCSQDYGCKVWGPGENEELHLRYDFIKFSEEGQLESIKKCTEDLGPYSLQVRKMKKYMVEKYTSMRVYNLVDVDFIFEEFFGSSSEEKKVNPVFDFC